MSQNMIKWTLGLLAVGCMLAMAGPATADWIPLTKDSSTFTRQYEMTTLMPSEENLDNNFSDPPLNLNPIYDFRYKKFNSGAASLIEGGLLRMYTGNGSYCYFGADDIDGRIWKSDADNFRFADGYTIEARIKVISSLGSLGAWHIIASPVDPGDQPEASLNISDTGLFWGSTPLGGTMDNTDVFHVFRIAQQEGQDNFRVWRDGDLLGEFAAPYSADYNRLIFGDRDSSTGNTWRGEVEVDYFRFTKGAYAPIPEPSTLILLVGGMLSLLVWRRR